MTTMTQVDAVLDSIGEDESPAQALANLIDETGGEWMRSENLDDKYAVVESSGAVWYVHEDRNGVADSRRCATWDEAYAMLPRGVS
jgi:hypothetical protein